MGRSMSEMIDFCLDLRMEYGFNSIWSADYFDSPADAHPFAGETELVYKVYFGKGEVRVPINGPTVKDFWAAAEAAINASGDGHHIFIEAFEVNPFGELELYTGS